VTVTSAVEIATVVKGISFTFSSEVFFLFVLSLHFLRAKNIVTRDYTKLPVLVFQNACYF